MILRHYSTVGDFATLGYTTFNLKGLLKTHGCTFDMATKTWRRPAVTVAERYAICVLKAREATRNAQMTKEEDALIDSIIAQAGTADWLRRQASWIGMEPISLTGAMITPEARARAWARHGLKPPASFFRGWDFDVYGATRHV